MEGSNINACLEMIFRWVHVVAGIAWIGHLYFFNFVNSQVVKTYDADSKRKVVPELMPRALYWFRWGAVFTWVTGLLLAGMVYYQSENLLPPDSTNSVGAGVGFSLLLIGAVFFIYDVLWKAMASHEQAGVVVLVLLMMILLGVVSNSFASRSGYIYV